MRQMAVRGMTIMIVTVMIMIVAMFGTLPVLIARQAAALFCQHPGVRRPAVRGTGDNKVGRG